MSHFPSKYIKFKRFYEKKNIQLNNNWFMIEKIYRLIRYFKLFI